MIKTKYKTLKGLVSKTRQYSLYTFLSGRMLHKSRGWVDVELSNDLNQQIEAMFKDFLGIKTLNKSRIYGVFERLVIEKRSLQVHYIAGQDYTAEIKNLKRWLQ